VVDEVVVVDGILGNVDVVVELLVVSSYSSVVEVVEVGDHVTVPVG